MSKVTELIDRLQHKTKEDGQKTTTQTVSLGEDSHQQLIRLSESLQISKTALASQLLAAAIGDAYDRVKPPLTDKSSLAERIRQRVSEEA